MALFSDDISLTTIVGAGSAFAGNLRVSGAMMVDGDIDGDLEITGNLIIGEKARIRGNISAKSAVISGTVLGDISAPDGIRLTESSTVLGDIATHRLQVEQGVVLHGHCISITDEESFEKDTLKQKQLKEIKRKSIIK